MAVFKKKSVAILVLIAVAVISTLVSGIIGVRELAEDIDEFFEDSLEDRIENAADAANGLISQLANHPECRDVATELKLARNSLEDAERAKDIRRSYLRLTQAVDAAESAVDLLELDEKESRRVNAYLSDFDAAAGGIRERYERLVEETQNRLSGFPASLFARIAGVDAASLSLD